MGINKNFVVRNGLEVANTLLYANDETNRIGINSGTPEHALDVIGDAAIDGALFSPVSLGGTSGVSGQYLQSTGDKWRWESFPKSRQTEKYTLTAGQTRIPASGSFGTFLLTETDLTSVFLDGVKLTEGDYVINSGGGSITLFAAAFGGEEVEIIGHGAASVGAGNTGILGVSVRKAGIDSGTPGRIQILDFVGLGVTLDGTTGLVTAYIDSGGLTDVVSDPSPQLGGYLDLNNRGIAGVGVITATEFYGDGSNITGISTLNIVDYGLGLGGGAAVSGVFGELEGGSSVGIFTDTAAVGLGTTDPRFLVEIGDRQSEIIGLGTNLWVNGDARITGILTVGSSSIAIDGINDEIRIGAGFTLTADTIAQTANLQITGIITATGFDGDLVGQHKVFTAGVSNSDDYDVALFLDPTQGGHTFNRYDLGGKLQYNPSTGQLSNAGVTSTRGLQSTGISTFTDSVTFQGNIQLGNNDQAIFGAGNDLRIFFDGTNSYIQDQGGGGLNIDANPSVTIGQYGTTEEMASFRVGAGVSLFYDNLKKFEIISAGATVTGTLFATDINTGIGTLSEVHTGTITAQGLDNLVLSAEDTNRYVQAEGIILNKSRQIYGSGGDIRILGGGGQTSRPNLYLGNGNGCILDAGSSASSGLSLKGGGSSGTVRVDEGDFIVGSNITLERSTGIITATSFVGDGSGLTGVTGTGSGVEIKDNDSAVGTAATINFGTGLSVSPVSVGIVTITAGASEVVNDSTPQLGGNLDLNSRTINGTGNINITGSSRFNGPTTCTSILTVNGITFDSGDLDLSTGSGNITLGSNAIYAGGVQYRFYASGDDSVLFHDNTDGSLVAVTNTNFIVSNVGFAQTSAVFTPTGAAELYYNDLKKFETIGTGATITGDLYATTFYGDGSNLTGIVAGYFDNNQTNPGIHTTAAHVGLGTTNPRTPLQVEEVYGVYTDYGNFSATAGVTTDGDASWVIATDDFKTAEYTLWFQYNDNIQSQKVLVINDGTTAYSQEYAIMFNNDLLISVGATISSGTCKLQWTPETGVSGIVTYRVVRETML